MNPVLLSAVAGALTMTARLVAVQEGSGSPVAVLGCSGTVAIDHILLATRGTVTARLLT